LSEERAAASPPPLWGRDRVGGIAEHQRSGVPPPLTPPHKGEGNPVAAAARESFHPLRVGDAGGQLSGISGSESNLPRSRLGALLAFGSHRSGRDDGQNESPAARVRERGRSISGIHAQQGICRAGMRGRASLADQVFCFDPIDRVISSLEPRPPSRALALRRGRTDCQVASCSLRSLLNLATSVLTT